jgi:hypothetical protein
MKTRQRQKEELGKNYLCHSSPQTGRQNGRQKQRGRQDQTTIKLTQETRQETRHDTTETRQGKSIIRQYKTTGKKGGGGAYFVLRQEKTRQRPRPRSQHDSNLRRSRANQICSKNSPEENVQNSLQGKTKTTIKTKKKISTRILENKMHTRPIQR